MKIKLISDLHLEISPYSISNTGEDILILAGDISTNFEQVKSLVMKYLNNCNSYIIFITGNHEYWGHTIQETDAFYSSIKHPRFFFLQNTSIVIDNIRFFGTTMWTDVDKGDSVDICANFVRDFDLINNFTIHDFMTLHRTAKEALENTLNTSKEKVIIITHHLPSYSGIAPKYHENPVNCSFASSDLEHIFDHKKTLMYFHGHTHTSMTYNIKGISVICNPRGYSRVLLFKGITNENKDFNENKIIFI